MTNTKASQKNQQIQSILVPKDHFKTEMQARKHVQQMGFKTNVKPVHTTENYYRYRQTNPLPSDQFRIINIGSDKAVLEIKRPQNKPNTKKGNKNSKSTK